MGESHEDDNLLVGRFGPADGNPPHNGFSLLIRWMSSCSTWLTLGPLWPTARFPAPIGPKPCPMPPQDRVAMQLTHPSEGRVVTGRTVRQGLTDAVHLIVVPALGE